MSKPFVLEPFMITPDHQRAEAHQAVSSWIEEALASRGERLWYQHADLKSLPSGQILAAAKPDVAQKYVMAALEQVHHWERAADRLREQADNPTSAHMQPGWNQVWGRRRQAIAAISALMRKALPFERSDLVALLKWCNEMDGLSKYDVPLAMIVRTLQRFADNQPLGDELVSAATRFATKLRAARDKESSRLATNVEQLFSSVAAQPESAQPAGPPPEPAPAGHCQVLVDLKRLVGMLPQETEELPRSHATPDGFAISDESPLKQEHEALAGLLNEMIERRHGYELNLEPLDHGKKLLDLPPEAACKVFLAAAERHIQNLLPQQSYDYSTAVLASGLAEMQDKLTAASRDDAFDFLLYLACCPAHTRARYERGLEHLIGLVERHALQSQLSEGERYVLWLLRTTLIPGPTFGAAPPAIQRLTKLIDDNATFCLAPGEVWSDAVNVDFSALPGEKRRQLGALLAHAATATAARPSEKWLKQAARLSAEFGTDSWQRSLQRWLPLVSQGQSVRKLGSWSGDARGGANTMNDENANCLRGILWLVPKLPQANELSRLVTGVALSAYKKVPGVGPRAVKVGNAAVYALSQLHTKEAVGQLAMLKVRVKFGTAQKEIEKAFNAAAEALGLPRDQIEEMGVPSYGLEPGGMRSETFGDYRAELVVTGSDAAITWFDAKGKQLKSVPAKVKQDHADDYKDLQQSLKDIQGMLPAQRDRIDGMFLLQKSWPLGDWLERYLQHPLVGTIARRLIWCVDGAPAVFIDERATDIQGKPIEHGRTAEITLWHPVGRSIEEITGWRGRLEELGIVQPFKQAHREVYLLTDAERNTRTYSNRYAAHVIRQHQFNALCAARGWKNRLRLMVDDSYEPPAKELPLWGLRAEYWVEGIGDGYGNDTNDSGVYLRLATDQLRFYRTGAAANWAHAGGGGYTIGAAGPGEDNINEPLPLDQIPPLVFSEIMRDVDLFVGVASVGNDPTWQDGGPEGRYRAYWQSYSFGELSGTATTRKQVLERLVPRLKIAGRCSFTDRFLVVRGQKRSYKIHLGSGNILMEPNDQYLCIVPDARSRSQPDDLFLPFEGDTTLSIILSKALLLAADDKIKDATITRQIEGT
jgi:hypothetical protein